MTIVRKILVHAASLSMVAFGSSTLMAQAAPQSASVGSVGSAQEGRSVSRTATQHFVDEAARANTSELDDARYALAHSQSPEVKDFAQKMLQDHTKAGEQLDQIAASDGYKVPSRRSPSELADAKRLEKDHGSAFDAAYSKSEDRDHRRVIAMFKRAGQNPRLDPKVRDFAQMTLPVLEEHLRMANKLVASVGGTRKAG